MTVATLVVREFKNHAIHQRQSDRYIDASAMCRANGKHWSDYWRTKSAKEFVTALSRSLKINRDLLIETRAVGKNETRATYVHPDLAINLAQWCSPDFAVLVSQWVNELLTTGKVELPQTVIPPLPLPPPPVPLPPSVRTVFPTNGQFDPLLAQLHAMVEMRQTQLNHEQRLSSLESSGSRSSQSETDNVERWFSIREWVDMIGLTTTEKQARKYSDDMDYFVQRDDIRVRKVPQTYGADTFRVSAYPEYILRLVIGSGNLSTTAPPRLS